MLYICAANPLPKKHWPWTLNVSQSSFWFNWYPAWQLSGRAWFCLFIFYYFQVQTFFQTLNYSGTVTESALEGIGNINNLFCLLCLWKKSSALYFHVLCWIFCNTNIWSIFYIVGGSMSERYILRLNINDDVQYQNIPLSYRTTNSIKHRSNTCGTKNSTEYMEINCTGFVSQT